MTINDPLRLPWMFTGLELTVIACAVLTLVHAIRRRHVMLWSSVFCYGVMMELLSYYAFDNYSHARFTVMFYHQKLPLYITGIYPLLIYPSIIATRRLRLGRAAEPFVVGFAVILLDVPWDVLNSAAAWWNWSSTDPNLRVRWLAVPVTNYYWHIAFDGGLAFLVRSAEPFVRMPLRQIVAPPLIGAATIVLGILAFIPFHVLTRAGVPDALVVALLFAGCAAALAAALRARRHVELDWPLLAVPILFHGFLLVVLATHEVGYVATAVVIVAVLLTAAFYALPSIYSVAGCSGAPT